MQNENKKNKYNTSWEKEERKMTENDHQRPGRELENSRE